MSHRCPVPRLHILRVEPQFRHDPDLGLLRVCDCDEVDVRPTMSKTMLCAAGQQGEEEEKAVHLHHHIGKTGGQLRLKIINQCTNSK